MDLKETYTNTHTQAYRCSWTEAILRNQVHAGHRLAHTWFNKSFIVRLCLLITQALWHKDTLWSINTISVTAVS